MISYQPSEHEPTAPFHHVSAEVHKAKDSFLYKQKHSVGPYCSECILPSGETIKSHPPSSIVSRPQCNSSQTHISPNRSRWDSNQTCSSAKLQLEKGDIMVNDKTSILCSENSLPRSSQIGFSYPQISWDYYILAQKQDDHEVNNILSSQLSGNLSNKPQGTLLQNEELKYSRFQESILLSKHNWKVVVTQDVPYCRSTSKTITSDKEISITTGDVYPCKCNHYMTDGDFERRTLKNVAGGVTKNLKTLKQCSRSRLVNRSARRSFLKETKASADRQASFKQSKYLSSRDNINVDTVPIQLDYLELLDNQARNSGFSYYNYQGSRQGSFSFNKSDQLISRDIDNPWVPVFTRLNEKDKLLVYEAILSLMNK